MAVRVSNNDFPGTFDRQPDNSVMLPGKRVLYQDDKLVVSFTNCTFADVELRAGISRTIKMIVFMLFTTKIKH